MQIKVTNLHHVYARKTTLEYHALRGVSAQIKQGDFVGIIGETGSGKTTFVEHLNCLLLPSEGQIILSKLTSPSRYQKQEVMKINSAFQVKINATSNQRKKNSLHRRRERKIRSFYRSFARFSDKLAIATTNSQKIQKLLRKRGILPSQTISSSTKKVRNVKNIRARVGVVFQFAEYQLFEETVQRDIAFGPLNLGVPLPQAITLAKKNLALVGLPESYLSKSPFELSGGEKRRVAIAGVLAMEPDFLIFDEPTSGLDPAGAQAILNIFRKLHSMGKTVIIVTHVLEDVLSVTSTTMLFRQGELVRYGPTLSVLQDVPLLTSQNLEAPRIIEFTKALVDKGWQINPTKTSEELVRQIFRRVKRCK